ncbi:hypothetical protein N8787_02500 [Opitutaceae bacterium]|nr:hypothetical protein [Opitutaceae bacterium]
MIPYARGNSIAGIKLDSGTSSESWLWKRDGLGSDSSTPIISDGRVIILKYSGPTSGRVTCLDIHSGETIWESNLPKSAKIFYASPVLANDIMRVAREDGNIFTVRVTDKGLADVKEYPLLESMIASPIAVNGKLLVRSDQHLYCFAD